MNLYICVDLFLFEDFWIRYNMGFKSGHVSTNLFIEIDLENINIYAHVMMFCVMLVNRFVSYWAAFSRLETLLIHALINDIKFSLKGITKYRILVVWYMCRVGGNAVILYVSMHAWMWSFKIMIYRWTKLIKRVLYNRSKKSQKNRLVGFVIAWSCLIM